MSGIDQPTEDDQGLPRALEVARGGVRPVLNDGVTKVLGFMLRHGECDAWVRTPHIEIRFSWLKKRNPSTYFGSLAPGMIAELMNFGGIEAIAEEETFFVKSGECGSGRYQFFFDRKWISIKLEPDQILIRVRSKKSELTQPLKPFGA